MVISPTAARLRRRTFATLMKRRNRSLRRTQRRLMRPPQIAHMCRVQRLVPRTTCAPRRPRSSVTVGPSQSHRRTPRRLTFGMVPCMARHRPPMHGTSLALFVLAAHSLLLLPHALVRGCIFPQLLRCFLYVCLCLLSIFGPDSCRRL